MIKLYRRQPGDISILSGINIPPFLKKIYIQRGINNILELQRNLHGLLTYHQLDGIEHAVDILVHALIKQFKIFIVGDFDTDGATGTALMVLALRQMGALDVNFIIPNRFEDGYGLSTKIVEEVIAHGAEIIITVDNGISSYSGVKLANQKGIPILITDHHLPGSILPNVEAIINPNLSKNSFALQSLAGVGVAFYVMCALRTQLKENGWFKQKKIIIPNLSKLLDLVALGTIADMSPLDFNNRILVYQGIKRIRSGNCRPGILALIETTNCNVEKLCAKDLGFILSPRLNAAGRLDNMSVGVSLLLTNDFSEARIFAAKLNSLNQIRHKIEQKMETKALDICSQIKIEQGTIPSGLVIYDATWHQGIVGILASRIKDRFNRPVIAFAPTNDSDNNIIKGSGRSIPGLHMRNLLEHINNVYPGVIVKFGGHEMAAGIMLKLIQLEKFCKCFVKLTNKWTNSSMLDNIIWSDGELIGSDLSLNTAELIRNSGPWGQGFPEPIFDGKFYIRTQRLISNNRHMQLKLESLTGGPIIDGIMFNIDNNVWPNRNIATAELAYKLEINEFYKIRTIQLVIQYIRPL